MEQFVTLSNLIAIAAIILFILYWLHAFIILYHLIRFGVGPRPKQVALLFFGGSFMLFICLMLTVMAVIYS